MPKLPIADEELQLRKRARRRLVGAIVLVLLVVVLVPMFLEREPRLQKQDIDIRIPPVPGQTQAVPPEASAPPASAQPATPSPAPAEAPPAVPTAPAEPPVAAPSTPASPPAAPSSESAAATAASPAFVIQLGAFSNTAKAKELMQLLKSNKFPAFTEMVTTPRGDRVRLRVGPYASEAAAQQARDRIKTLKLMVVDDAQVVRAGE